MLEKLDKANLFIAPLDNERRWYRYHHLFADLLRKQLGRTQPDLVAGLHRLASEWYENNGLISEAVNHLLAIGDTEEAASLVEGNALAMMDHVGNARHGVEIPCNYLTPDQWVNLYESTGLKPITLRNKLGLYIPLLNWFFERNLHFIAVLEPST